MSKLERLPERMLDLASQAGDRISDLAPRASDWLDAGAKLGALKTASKVGMTVVRRNPIVFTAALAGAGLIWYAARRRARRAESGEGQTIEGTSRRIEARNGNQTKSRGAARKTGTRRTAARKTAASETRTEH